MRPFFFLASPVLCLGCFETALTGRWTGQCEIGEGIDVLARLSEADGTVPGSEGTQWSVYRGDGDIDPGSGWLRLGVQASRCASPELCIDSDGDYAPDYAYLRFGDSWAFQGLHHGDAIEGHCYDTAGGVGPFSLERDE